VTASDAVEWGGMFNSKRRLRLAPALVRGSVSSVYSVGVFKLLEGERVIRKNCLLQAGNVEPSGSEAQKPAALFSGLSVNP
jgi:hypothetical protein